MKQFPILVALLAICTCSVFAQANLGRTGNSGITVGKEQIVRLHTDRVDWFDDFLGDIVQDEYTLLEGTDTATAAQAIVAGAQHGVFRLTTGDHASADVAANGSEIVLGRHWSADQASQVGNHDRMIFEARVRMNTQVTGAQVCIGFTDSITLEMPASISGTTITTNFTDGVVFAYDTAATTDQWYAVGVKNNTDSSGNIITGKLPVADTYQYFRIILDSNGTASCYISGDAAFTEGDLVATLPNAVTTSVLLTPVFIASANTANSITVDMDYLYSSALRD